jgi:hypothetical protein
MPWWALIPVVTTISGPVALYLVTRRKRRPDGVDERYEDLSRKYTALLEESTAGELPNGRARYPDKP